VSDPPCNLLGEIHSTLIYNLRTVPFTRHSALVSLLRLKEEGEAESYFGITLDQLVAAMADVGNNWERVPLRHSEGRDGWEEALVGCIKDVSLRLSSKVPRKLIPLQHASLDIFPLLQQVLTCLLFAPDTPPDSSDSGESSSSESKPLPPPDLVETARPGDRYYSLPSEYKIAIISFMCHLSNASKAIHGHMEFCEEQLTSLRKEKIEVNRTKKQL
jgi:bromodomain adjacent to zinc finger domain protein 1A